MAQPKKVQHSRKKKVMARPSRTRKKAASRKATPHYGLLWLPVLISFSLLAGLAVFYVWEHIKLKEIRKEIIELQNARDVLLKENSRLRAQVTELSSFRRIYPIAKKHFGFVELKPRIIVVPDH